MQGEREMADKKFYSPQEALEYLNEKLHPEPPLNAARLARLRCGNRIHGERVGTTLSSIYTKKALDMVSLSDIQDKRKSHGKRLDKVTTS